MSIVLSGYLLFALVTFGYAATFASFSTKLRGETMVLAKLRIACGLMFLLFCGLFVYLWSFDRTVSTVIGVTGTVVLVITMFSVRPLLRVPEGDPRFGNERHNDDSLQRR